MELSKTFFEQIPVETVKKIAQEFSDKDAIPGGAGSAPTPDEAEPASWRVVAEMVQQESDPQKMTALVEQLITMLDQKQVGKHSAPTRDAGTHSDLKRD